MKFGIASTPATGTWSGGTRVSSRRAHEPVTKHDNSRGNVAVGERQVRCRAGAGGREAGGQEGYKRGAGAKAVAAVTISLLGSALLVLGGCANRPLRPVNADGTYCVKQYRTSTCTTAAVPPAAVEAQAKRFEGRPDALTLYIVRKHWGDAVNRVSVSIDNRTSLITIPESLVRITAASGTHRLAIEWAGKAQTIMISGAAGQVRLVQLIGFLGPFKDQYWWADLDEADARKRALASKLIADVDVRQ
jgi:hypothetical protein